MFTGIVQVVGKVQDVRFPPGHTPGNVVDGLYTLVIEDAGKILESASIGDSVAVDGVCLTLVTMDKASGSFSVELCTETLNKTSLGYLKAGDYVNLENSLTKAGFLGGHIVQGHVDTTARIVSFSPHGAGSYLLILEINPASVKEIIPLMAKKGYACVDGISLTIVEVDRTRGQISFNIIPHTMKATTMHVKSPGDIINIEADCMAKMLSSYMDCVLQDRDSILMSSIEEAIERKLGKS